MKFFCSSILSVKIGYLISVNRSANQANQKRSIRQFATLFKYALTGFFLLVAAFSFSKENDPDLRDREICKSENRICISWSGLLITIIAGSRFLLVLEHLKAPGICDHGISTEIPNN